MQTTLVDSENLFRLVHFFDILAAVVFAVSGALYKMASSLGASFGVAISAAIFTALAADSESTRWLEGVITFAGRQDNIAIRQAALIALGFNLVMVVAAIVSIMLTVPEGRTRGDMQ